MADVYIYYDEASGAPLWGSDRPARAAANPCIRADPQGRSLSAYQVIDGQLTLRANIPEPVRADAVAEVNTLRGDARRPWITVLPGQEMIYLNKEREALRYMDDPDPQPQDYPSLAAEVGITAPTLYEVVQVILNLAALWRGISAQIEAICLGAIAQIEGATTFSEIDAAVEAARLALEGLS